MKIFHFQFAVAALMLAASLQVHGQTNVHRTVLSSNRYLIVVETSRSMDRRSAANLKAVEDLLVSGMSGQLRRGDTLGVWTYNETLNAGHFPLQQWSAEAHPQITQQILSFLKAQSYGRKANLENVLLALDPIIKNSKLITIILISSGEQPIHGTPFDQQINETYQLWATQQQKARLPLLTILRAKDGTLTNCAVNPAPWHSELPPLPPEPAPVQVAHTNAAPAKPTRPIAQPLIITGKKPDPATTQKPPETITPKAEPGNTLIATNGTNHVTPAASKEGTPGTPHMTPTQSIGGSSGPAIASSASDRTAPGTTQNAAAQNPARLASSEQGKAEPTKPEAVKGTPPKPSADFPDDKTALQPNLASAGETGKTAGTDPAPAPRVTSSSESTKTPTTPETNPKPGSEIAPRPGTTQLAGEQSDSEPLKASPAQAALTVTSRPWFNPVLAGAVVLLLILTGLLLHRLRGQRVAAAQASLITRSLERERK